MIDYGSQSSILVFVSNGLYQYNVMCRFAVSCSYSGVGGFESSTSTIDVVADVKSEKVFDIHF